MLLELLSLEGCELLLVDCCSELLEDDEVVVDGSDDEDDDELELLLDDELELLLSSLDELSSDELSLKNDELDVIELILSEDELELFFSDELSDTVDSEEPARYNSRTPLTVLTRTLLGRSQSVLVLP